MGQVVEPFFVKTASKPSLSVTSTSHKYLTHTFNFPGSVTWDDITVTMVDPGGPDDATTRLLNAIKNSGYMYPTSPTQLGTISKLKSVNAFDNTFVITQLNADGQPVETWTLHNAFITKVGNGSLSYSSEDLVELSLTIKYDYAILNGKTN